MAKCTKCNDPSINCGDVIFAPCVYFEIPEGDLQEYISGGSSTEPTECINLDSALEEIYTKIKDLEELTDFSEFESECLDLDDEPTLQTIITALDEKVCELNETINGEDGLSDICTILGKDISECEDLDFSCITTDSCDNAVSITTFKSWIQWVTDEICALKAAAE